MDTAKRHSDGSPVVQINWYTRILEALKGEGEQKGDGPISRGK